MAIGLLGASAASQSLTVTSGQAKRQRPAPMPQVALEPQSEADRQVNPEIAGRCRSLLVQGGHGIEQLLKFWCYRIWRLLACDD